MNDHSPLNSFIHLVDFDQSVLALRNTIEKHEHDIKQVHEVVAQLEDAFEQRKRAVVQLKKDVDSKELEMKSLDQQESEKKRLLDQAKNNKEYQGLLKDLEHIQERQVEYEKQLLAAWNALEHAQTELVTQSTQYEQKRSEVLASVDLKTSELVKIKEELNERMKERDALLQGIPVEWLSKYAMMQSRVSNPVVAIKRDSCGACGVSIPAQDLVALRHRALIQCKNCYRFLYTDNHETT